MASRSSSSAGVQLLDFSTLESSAPDSMPQKRRRTGGGGAGGEQPRNRNLPVPNAQFERELAATKVKYTRTVGGEGAEKLVTKKIGDKKLRGSLERTDKKYEQAIAEAARAEILLPAARGTLEAVGPMDRTYKFTQAAIGDEVDVQTRRKMYDLQLDQFGPYAMDYSRSGRHLLLAGSMGHVAMLNAHTFRLQTEFHLKETVRDVTFLHNNSMFAVAQKQYAYIYDAMGVELHCLRNHVEPTRLEFLPYHFLLVSASKTGFFKYTDVSTGKLIVELRSKLGPCDTLAHNARNAIILGGHGNGQVTMWSPNMTAPLVKMQCHRGPVRAVAVCPSTGHYMATAGADGQLKLWDARTYRVLHEHYTLRPASALSISQTGLLGVGFGPHVHVWQDAFGADKQQAPYMVHQYAGNEVRDLAFCPFEDLLGVSHSRGFGSVVVPGAGEANFDSFATDLYASKKQRQETEVRQLLDKLQPEMITLDSGVIGTVDRASKETLKAEKQESIEAAAARFLQPSAVSSAAAGAAAGTAPAEAAASAGRRSNSAKKLKRRRANIIDTETKARKDVVLKDKLLDTERRRQAELHSSAQRSSSVGARPRSALERFMQ